MHFPALSETCGDSTFTSSPLREERRRLTPCRDAEFVLHHGCAAAGIPAPVVPVLPAFFDEFSGFAGREYMLALPFNRCVLCE